MYNSIKLWSNNYSCVIRSLGLFQIELVNFDNLIVIVNYKLFVVISLNLNVDAFINGLSWNSLWMFFT